ncbi:MAG: hypothetical protein EXX96DRAFT_461817, partial [Benjaminiella poitrasii]
PLVPQKHRALEENCQNLLAEDKWVLRGGKVVEDSLDEFSKKCLIDHPACSMIIYTEDDTYLNNNVFTKEELREITEETPLSFTTPIPGPLADYMNKFDQNNIANLRAMLIETLAWEKEYNIQRYHDFDWVKLTVFLYVRLYESGELLKEQLETWYDRKIWCLIDSAFDDIPSLQIIRGESESMASKLRKNNKRTIGSVAPILRMKNGRKCDFDVRETKALHEEASEFGVGESGRYSNDTKTLLE